MNVGNLISGSSAFSKSNSSETYVINNLFENK